MIPCPHCGTQLNDTARFCRKCGKAIPTGGQSEARVSASTGGALPAAPSKRFCTSCGKEITPTAKFCPHCRTELTPSQLFTPPATSTSAPALAAAPPIHAPGKVMPGAIPGPPSPSTGKIPLGTVVNGRYVIQSILGIGGMGAVYMAVDNHLNNPVALKEMSDSHLQDPAERQKAINAFRNEATLLSTLCHPNLPRVTDFFSEGDNQFLVMDYVPGETLAQMLDNRSQAFDETQVLVWAEQLCDVLQYLHTRHPPVIFRDLKPGNVMVLPDGKTLKLIDFGIVRLFRQGASKDTMTLGTPGYAPPEQFGKAQTDARSDIYALGALLHHLLTLRDPGTEMFKFPTARSLNSKVSTMVDDAIQKAVQVRADQRWSSAAEFKTALLEEINIQSTSVASSTPASATPPQPAPVKPAVPIFPPIAPPGIAQSSIHSPATPSTLVTAGLGPRLGAYLLDNFILGLVMGAFATFIFSASSNVDEVMPVFMALVGGSMLGYFALFHSTSGQTPGKKSASLKVVRMDGSRLGFMRALWRTLMMIAPPALITLAFGGLPVGVLVWTIPYFNAERRALHDYLSDTRVVKI